MKKFLGIFLALVMMFSASTLTAFAAEPETDNIRNATFYDMEVDSSGIVSITDEDGNEVDTSDSEGQLRSSISGYNQADLTNTSNGLLVWVNASGIGGMGITVETSCSTWNGTVTLHIAPNSGSAVVNGDYISVNDHVEYHNLLHASPAYYYVGLGGIPSGHTVHIQVWIYG